MNFLSCSSSNPNVACSLANLYDCRHWLHNHERSFHQENDRYLYSYDLFAIRMAVYRTCASHCSQKRQKRREREREREREKEKERNARNTTQKWLGEINDRLSSGIRFSINRANRGANRFIWNRGYDIRILSAENFH